MSARAHLLDPINLKWKRKRISQPFSWERSLQPRRQPNKSVQRWSCVRESFFFFILDSFGSQHRWRDRASWCVCCSLLHFSFQPYLLLLIFKQSMFRTELVLPLSRAQVQAYVFVSGQIKALCDIVVGKDLTANLLMGLRKPCVRLCNISGELEDSRRKVCIFLAKYRHPHI